MKRIMIFECIFDGGELGSTGVVRVQGDQRQIAGAANDNVPFEFALAA